MIYISVVELIPSLFLDEDEEEQQPYGDHQQVQRLSQDTESEERWKSMQKEISTPYVANARCTQQKP